MLCNFSFEHYKYILTNFIYKKYTFLSFDDFCKSKEKSVFLRHDIDKNHDKAVILASIEEQLKIKSTFFIRLHSGYYNPFSYRCYENIKKIIKMGHYIALHTEAIGFSKCQNESSKDIFMKEMYIFSKLFKDTKMYSHHRTGCSNIFEKDWKDFDDWAKNQKFINASELKSFWSYFSDSGGIWKKHCPHTIKTKHIYIVTHPIWWYENNIEMEDPII